MVRKAPQGIPLQSKIQGYPYDFLCKGGVCLPPAHREGFLFWGEVYLAPLPTTSFVIRVDEKISPERKVPNSSSEVIHLHPLEYKVVV